MVDNTIKIPDSNKVTVYMSSEDWAYIVENYYTISKSDEPIAWGKFFFQSFLTAMSVRKPESNPDDKKLMADQAAEIKTLTDQNQSLSATIVNLKLEHSGELAALNSQIAELRQQIESLGANSGDIIAITEKANSDLQAKESIIQLQLGTIKDIKTEVEALKNKGIGENQVLITFSPLQKAMLQETKKLLQDRNINYSDDEILARLFVDFTVKGPCDVYPRVLKIARIKELKEQYEPASTV
jgi:hypothetical protein